MTRDDILRMAKECDFGVAAEFEHNLNMLSRFATLVAAHEREQCARLCYEAAPSLDGQLCAEAIRKRGEE
jgi:hypothetical protein